MLESVATESTLSVNEPITDWVRISTFVRLGNPHKIDKKTVPPSVESVPCTAIHRLNRPSGTTPVTGRGQGIANQPPLSLDDTEFGQIFRLWLQQSRIPVIEAAEIRHGHDFSLAFP